MISSLQTSFRSGKISTLAVMALFAGIAFPFAATAVAQQDVPPAGPAPQASNPNDMPDFPAPDPKDFTAESPTKEQVVGFLKASWGYDTKRLYQVQRIAKTVVPGVSSVVVLVGEKGNKQSGGLQFFVLQDGKHLISSGDILPFGEHPYADNRATLMQRANGPSKGAADKNLEIVEFADFQCPHCKDAQGTIAKIVADYPNAHFVYQSFPLVSIHPQAARAAAYGVCVAKLGGEKAFFDYGAAVYDGQEGLNTDEGATLTLNTAVTKAGQSPDKVEACSKTPETEAAVKAQIKLADDLNVNQTPSLAVNGRIIPIGGSQYDTIKNIIDWHIANDSPAK